MSYSAFPLHWPPGFPRVSVRYKSKFGEKNFGFARDNLIHEIDLLGGRKIVLSTNVPLRADGLPYADNRRIADPGVAVYFDYREKPRVFACDKWSSTAENMWALAKTIDAIRGIARWGASDMLERAFTGFTALPASTSVRTPWQILEVPRTATLEQLKNARIKLAQIHHPDHGGSAERMAEINRAYDAAIKERAL